MIEHDDVAPGAGGFAEVLEAVEAGTGVRADHQENQRLGRVGWPDRQLGHHVFELGGVVAESILGRPQRPIDPKHGHVGQDQENDEAALEPDRSTSTPWSGGFAWEFRDGLDLGRVESAMS